MTEVQLTVILIATTINLSFNTSRWLEILTHVTALVEDGLRDSIALEYLLPGREQLVMQHKSLISFMTTILTVLTRERINTEREGVVGTNYRYIRVISIAELRMSVTHRGSVADVRRTRIIGRRLKPFSPAGR